MKIQVDISVGEYLDKYSILKIKEEKGLELTIPLPATEDKSMLDRIREGASSYDKKITDAINYVTPPELRPILRGIELLAPFQNLPKYDFNKWKSQLL